MSREELYEAFRERMAVGEPACQNCECAEDWEDPECCCDCHYKPVEQYDGTEEP